MHSGGRLWVAAGEGGGGMGSSCELAAQEQHSKTTAEREAKKAAAKQARAQGWRPKSSYKGLTWHSSSGMWLAQLWTGERVSACHQNASTALKGKWRMDGVTPSELFSPEVGRGEGGRGYR